VNEGAPIQRDCHPHRFLALLHGRMALGRLGALSDKAARGASKRLAVDGSVDGAGAVAAVGNLSRYGALVVGLASFAGDHFP
jgi:hypothetical protein